jgi:protoporphyrinogen oxidase
MNVTVLGGGLSALSLAYFLQNDEKIDKITILEKDDVPGGLCRSYDLDSIKYDAGPHIIFSKDKEILDLMISLLGENVNKLKRSNQIIYKDKYVQYPFENDLSKLPKDDLDYCVTSFMSNPYTGYNAQNMLQFFLKTFGEGITNTYLRPYNEKIWKYDPSFMDTQMVERIPRPPDEDIIRSSKGETIEGYLHQLFFYYPKSGGFEALIKAFISSFNGKVSVLTSQTITAVDKKGEKYSVTSNGRTVESDLIVSTIPVMEFVKLYGVKDQSVEDASDSLKYNSTILMAVNTACDLSGHNFCFTIPDKEVIFHRISKLDFYGENYHIDGTATYILEISYRKGDYVDSLSDGEIVKRVKNGLEKIGFIKSDEDMLKYEMKRFPYTYVIYDLKHKENMSVIRRFFQEQGILLNGRFGNFEYWNADTIIRKSKDLSDRIQKSY